MEERLNPPFFYGIFSTKFSRKANIWFENKFIAFTFWCQKPLKQFRGFFMAKIYGFGLNGKNIRF